MTPEGIDIEALLKAQGITTGDSTTTEMHVVQMEDSSPREPPCVMRCCGRSGSSRRHRKSPSPGRPPDRVRQLPAVRRAGGTGRGLRAGRSPSPALRHRVRVGHPACCDEDPRRWIGLHHVGRRAAGVPRTLDCLHSSKRRHPYLDRVTRLRSPKIVVSIRHDVASARRSTGTGSRSGKERDRSPSGRQAVDRVARKSPALSGPRGAGTTKSSGSRPTVGGSSPSARSQAVNTSSGHTRADADRHL